MDALRWSTAASYHWLLSHLSRLKLNTHSQHESFAYLLLLFRATFDLLYREWLPPATCLLSNSSLSVQNIANVCATHNSHQQGFRPGLSAFKLASNSRSTLSPGNSYIGVDMSCWRGESWCNS